MKASGLLLVTMEPPSAMEEEFNDWYDTEHFPQRSMLPGFLTATRWVCIQGWPKWLALYDLESLDALATTEYLAVSGTRSTPWSKRVLPRTIGRQRLCLQQLKPGCEPMRDTRGNGALILSRHENAEVVDLEIEYKTHFSASQVRIFGSEKEPSASWVVARIPFAAGPTIISQAMASRPTGFGVYVPYQR